MKNSVFTVLEIALIIPVIAQISGHIYASK